MDGNSLRSHGLGILLLAIGLAALFVNGGAFDHAWRATAHVVARVGALSR